MRILSSYNLAVILCLLFTISVIVMITVEHFSVIVEDNIEKVSGMEKSTNFRHLEAQLENIKQMAEKYDLKAYTKDQALDIIIKYADHLLAAYNAKAETDRPDDENSVLSLRVSFDVKFKSAQDFLRTIGEMLRMKSPIVQINALTFSQNKLNDGTIDYKISLEAVIVQPYIAGDVTNEQQ